MYSEFITNANNFNKNISLSNFVKGFYFVQIISKEEIYNNKLVVF